MKENQGKPVVYRFSTIANIMVQLENFPKIESLESSVKKKDFSWLVPAKGKSIFEKL